LDFKSQGFQKSDNLNISKFSSSEFLDNGVSKKRTGNLDTSKLNSSMNSNDDLNLFLFGAKKKEKSNVRNEIELN